MLSMRWYGTMTISMGRARKGPSLEALMFGGGRVFS
jgi:hypothetical protein